MSFFTLNTTVNETPDTTQGGLAVTGVTNTGHGSTTSSAAFNGSQSKTARWSGFPAGPSGQILQAVLKVDWTEDGSEAAPGTNQFRIQYSINGGGAWITLRNDTGITAPTSGTESVTLSNAQDLTQVQVRDLMKANGGGAPEGSASITTTISQVRIEVTQSTQPIVCW